MIDAINRLTLDISSEDIQGTLNCVQYDNARQFDFILVNKGKPYHIASGCTAVIRMVKPDMTIAYNNCTITGDLISYTITNQNTAVAGNLICELTLYGSGSVKQLTSTKFNIRVLASLYSDDEVESEDEFTALQTAITNTNNLNVSASKTGTVTTVTITNKNGTTNTVNINDGETGATGPQGPQGPAGQSAPVVQTTGQSTTDVMSQKAVTDALSYLDNIFVAIYGTTTYNEIKAKSLAGKAVVCLYQSDAGKRTYILSNVTNNACVFTTVFNPSSLNYMQLRQLTVTVANAWTATTVPIERQSNRVNEFISGEPEADTKYPSCECLDTYASNYTSVVFNHKINYYAYEMDYETEQVTDYADVMFSIQDDYGNEYDNEYQSLLNAIKSKKAIVATGTYHQQTSTTATRQIIQVHYNESNNRLYASVIGTNGQGVFGIEVVDISSATSESAAGFSMIDISDTVTKYSIGVL